MRVLTKDNIQDICESYKKGATILELYRKYKISDRRVRRILVEHNIEIYNSHSRTVSKDDYFDKCKDRFLCDDEHKFIAISKIDGSIFNDFLNQSGVLSKHIFDKLNIKPPTLFFRKKFFHENGFQWYEKWFDIKCIENKRETLKCPFCSWETVDIENTSGMFETHLLKEHSMTIDKFVKKYPSFKTYFSAWASKVEKKKFVNQAKNHISCPICNEKLSSITYTHLKYKHGISFREFKEQYPFFNTISKNTAIKLSECGHKASLNVTKNRYVSKSEKEIQNYISLLGIECDFNRQILIGKEIDILIPSLKIGIEYDGLKWHTEWFGKKDHLYHLNKTIDCNKKGYGLLHIFEDEYINNKELVLSKIKHILKMEDNEIKVGARKCTISQITKTISDEFLDKYHIQGSVSATIYYGAYYENKLIGVMTFKKENKDGFWELSRYATDYHYICQGLGGKLFKHFINENNPIEVKSFADRRWTLNAENNLYTKLGFSLENTLRPDYRYYNERIDRYQRFHKFGFRKQILHKKYGLPLSMTETEMVKELGYDRIWDCGLFKYVWRHDND